MEEKSVRAGFYQHFKGGKYYVFWISVNTETGEAVVEYMPLYGEHAGKHLHRTFENFTEVVDRPDFNYKGPRFFLE